MILLYLDSFSFDALKTRNVLEWHRRSALQRLAASHPANAYSSEHRWSESKTIPVLIDSKKKAITSDEVEILDGLFGEIDA